MDKAVYVRNNTNGYKDRNSHPHFFIFSGVSLYLQLLTTNSFYADYL